MEQWTFGPYEVRKLLGRGGMGEVYEAFDTDHDRTVALKLLVPHLSADEGYRARFRRECQLAARLNEPHVIPIHSFGEIDDRLFLDMRLVRGSDLGELLHEYGPPSPRRAVSIISQVARALDAAHEDGLIHRDVKPSNVLVTDSDDNADDSTFIYLVDFGVARAMDSDREQPLTEAGGTVGTFEYMPPERFLGADADRRTDVYALACLLYETLTGRRPFTGDNLATYMYAHLNAQPPRPSQSDPDIPAALDEVVAQGLAKDPQTRFQTAGALAAAARQALRRPRPAAPPRPAAQRPAPPPTGPAVAGAAMRPGLSGPVPWGSVGAPPAVGTLTPPPRTMTPPPRSMGPASMLPPSMTPPSMTPPPRTNTPPPPSGPSGPVGYPGGPQSGPVPFAPPAGADNRRKVLIGSGLGALVVIAIVVIALVVRSRDSGQVGQGITGGSSFSASSTTPPATSLNSGQAALNAVIPSIYQSQCRPAETPNRTGATAALACGSSPGGDGPSSALFVRYTDENTLKTAFLAQMADQSVKSTKSDCPAVGYRQWYYTANKDHTAGQQGSYVEVGSGNAQMAWSNNDDLYFATVTGANGKDGISALCDWWRSNA